MDEPLQIAFITDGKALDPTLVALFSALEHCSVPVRVIFVGLELGPRDWQRVRAVVAPFADATLIQTPFDPALVAGVTTQAAHISRATFARLFLHRMTRGRVLYLDGDILVTGDLAPLARLDLRDRPVAAVCDYVVQHWAAAAQTSPRRQQRLAERLGRIAAITAPAPPASYVNAGVMLFDMDQIAADPVLTSRLEDVAAAARQPMADQDHLNAVFAGRILHLGPEWNCSWGRLARQHRDLAATGVPTDPATASARPVILHYHGPRKPWQPAPLKGLLRFVPEAFRYRRAQHRMRRDITQPLK